MSAITKQFEESLKYIIEDSTIAEILGVQNFSNEASAILELVKNAYDAKAADVTISISKKQIVIEDSGDGMNREDIRRVWMHVGKSEKGYFSSDEERVLAGSKGVGRFAMARLGALVSVYTKKENNEAVIWKTDWNKNTLNAYPEKKTKGTRIEIEELRDNWTLTRVNNLKEFLSRTYNDNKMKISVVYKEKNDEIQAYFDETKLGVHCVSIIKLNYDSQRQKLNYEIVSDEFKEDVAKICPQVNITGKTDFLDMKTELIKIKKEYVEETSYKESDEHWEKMLADIGDFSAEFYFSLKEPIIKDVDKFFYKYRALSERYKEGIVLYRNAFSISSYEGKKDWLMLGKRSRISPAAASHLTGAWRVRENQISGKVIIDKKNNQCLADLMNRQGLVENDSYKLFIEILQSGIACFERYRQDIIRSIVRYRGQEKEEKKTVLELVLIEHKKLWDLSKEDQKELVKELKQEEKNKVAYKREQEEKEQQYKYDIRLLNAFATSGLKAVSIAHETRNRRNSIADNGEYIIKALKRYNLWDIVNNPENRELSYCDIPGLIEKNQRLSKKILSFMDVMLQESEKKQFYPENLNIYSYMNEIKKIWEKDYSWVKIFLHIDEELTFKSTKDMFRVIFDNLILNSIQQNETKNSLEINIYVEQKDGKLNIVYMDNGNGLPEKFKREPRRILEVHESSRPEGHGIGMWMLNNTVVYSGGSIENIESNDGFKIEFKLGGIII